ncbi:hypothetical protein CPJCM30710_21050 [Clostridium polyendosporum]|uniref:Uncharacterized protein n=1 Tax=Clostridium polyendosporum TaxID=69208 RepID=A0A919S059_9CLOT|nr:hypothetical protein CPJCM30710_21050 [Clostridium polyendosporum]
MNSYKNSLIIKGMVITENNVEKDTIRAEYSFSLLKFSAKIDIVAPVGIACIKIKVFITIDLSLNKVDTKYNVIGTTKSFIKTP